MEDYIPEEMRSSEYGFCCASLRIAVEFIIRSACLNNKFIESVVLSGKLKKRSDHLKQWNSRYFVVTGVEIRYYLMSSEHVRSN